MLMDPCWIKPWTASPLTQAVQKGRPARPQRLKKAEVEVKVKYRPGSFFLTLA